MTRRRAAPRSRRTPRPSGRGRRPPEPRDAAEFASEGWVEYGGELIWAVGFTASGVPYGLRASELAPADLAALGLADTPPTSTAPWADDPGFGEPDGE